MLWHWLNCYLDISIWDINFEKMEAKTSIDILLSTIHLLIIMNKFLRKKWRKMRITGREKYLDLGTILHQTFKPFVSKRFPWWYWLRKIAQKYSCLEKLMKNFQSGIFKIFSVNFNLIAFGQKFVNSFVFPLIHFLASPIAPTFPLFSV